MELPLNVLFGVEFQSDEGKFHHSRGNDMMREGEQKTNKLTCSFYVFI